MRRLPKKRKAESIKRKGERTSVWRALEPAHLEARHHAQALGICGVALLQHTRKAPADRHRIGKVFCLRKSGILVQYTVKKRSSASSNRRDSDNKPFDIYRFVANRLEQLVQYFSCHDIRALWDSMRSRCRVGKVNSRFEEPNLCMVNKSE